MVTEMKQVIGFRNETSNTYIECNETYAYYVYHISIKWMKTFFFSGGIKIIKIYMEGKSDVGPFFKFWS